MPTTVIWVLVALAVVAIAAYILIMIMRKGNENRIHKLEEEKEKLLDLPIQDEIDAVKKMHLVGQSQNIYREWNQKWIDLSSNSFADLEKHLFDAEELNNHFHFLNARTEIDACEKQLDLMKDDAGNIRGAISELAAQEQRNSTKIQESLDLYEGLRNEISENAEAYGTTIGEIEKQLNNIEEEFTNFVTLNSTGDPIEAAEVLENAEEHTIALGNITKRIPEIVKTIDEEFPRKISELNEGYDKFEELEYKLPATLDFKQEISNIQDRMKSSTEFAERFELDRAESEIKLINDDINELYEVFESEYAASRLVEQNAGSIKSYIDHTRDNNKNLLLEIDHVSQSYVLTGNEMGQVRAYQAQIEQASNDAEELLEDIAENTEANSVFNSRLKAIQGLLEEIEDNQLKINDSLSRLKVSEKDAQVKADAFDIELRTIKRYVEKLNLPGLPKEYLDLFYMATSRVESLFKELNKVRVNVDTVNHLLDISNEDMNVLEDATDKLTDDANLAEQLIQYSNRYKTTDGEVAKAFNRAVQVFDNEWDYGKAREDISTALEQAEPGAVDRISNFYFNNKEVPDYKGIRR
ncbi:septation ring formation regulator EzrA [Floricoccus penangensis]|uniref:septation ring formation regulator EzrA n=1 Tax=Floricoccus penangensis TaxID=1859475 RepID=UPI00203DD629|nr:septation ring formation regulator EzrA [Floricoccus penangensis]URZ87323.1 septation ring formation regulator EzrA [Floricoccus penangensis]